MTPAPAIFLMCPTASGKTGAAVALATALPVEIISVDSALVYRDMDIGTAKPDAATLQQAPHHLINLIPPTQAYSAANFRQDALGLMADISARGRIPLLVGGTMLYFKALEQGMSGLPEADAQVRMSLDAEAAAIGWPAMHAKLAAIDALTAARLAPNDSQRIQRALEVHAISGRRLSDLIAEQSSQVLPYQVLKIALLPSDRQLLHARIAMRFEQMLAAGLVEGAGEEGLDFDSRVTVPLDHVAVGRHRFVGSLPGIDRDRKVCLTIRASDGDIDAAGEVGVFVERRFGEDAAWRLRGGWQQRVA